MSSRKRKDNNENVFTPISAPERVHQVFGTPGPLQNTQINVVFTDGFTPVPNLKKRRVAQPYTPEDLTRLRKERELRDTKESELRERKAAEQKTSAEQMRQQARDNRLHISLEMLKSMGWSTLEDFMDALVTTKHPSCSSQVSRYFARHGGDLFNKVRQRQPSTVNDWALSTARELIAKEGRHLADCFRPVQNTPICDILDRFSISGFLSDAERLAPSTYHLLQQMAFCYRTAPQDPKRKNHDLIIASTLCMLVKARNEHASEFQTTMAMYFLACGSSRTLFDVLNHVGLTLSYTHAVLKLKQLSLERLDQTRKAAKSSAFMLIWDNLNIAFKVSEQRQNSKDHFDNGTTATLVPLYGVSYGDLNIGLKPMWKHRIPHLEYTAQDLVPTAEEARRVQDGQIWHIMDILLNAFPDLRKRFAKSIPSRPVVQAIPVHTTTQYPLPAMHIDESSLEGTLGVVKTIFRESLQLTEEEVRAQGIVICGGDQLTLSLLDKASAIRRDDANFMDNIGLYTVGQEGLLHIKFSHTRMVANEFWGKPNARAAWSLWKVNSLLARKPISVGWKAKKPAPFRPIYELMLNLALVANVLDGFRIYGPKRRGTTLESWVNGVASIEEVHAVACKISDELCSGRQVEQLRQSKASERDVILENIILFNRDCLYLRQLKYAIKFGDVGAILDIIKHSMLAFRGSSKTPKYADTLFSMIVRLRQMKPKLQNAWLMNWLANLSGRIDGFKEMDLLQEHQNFWLKIIYIAKGSNRSWAWLSMVSVAIFALRDVMRQVQSEFQIPINNTFHTSPTTNKDIKLLCNYLETQRVQEYHPTRGGNDDSIEARDLIEVGSAYANKPSAFRNFTYTRVRAVNNGLAEDISNATNLSQEPEGEEEGIDLDADKHVQLDDLTLDDEEFPMSLDVGEYVSMVRDVVDELSRYE